MTNSAKSVVLLVIGLALFAGVVALAIDVVKEAFQSPGTPLLKAETFRTADTPFRSWTVSRVVFVIVFAMAVMAVGAATVVLRSRLATVVSLLSLLALIVLVLFTPIGRYGLGTPREIAAAPTDDRFIRLESGVIYDVAGKLPFAAVPLFGDGFPEEGPQDIRPDFERRVDLRLSGVAPSVPLFEVSGTSGSAYLRQLVLEEYEDGVWTQDPSVEYDLHASYASGLRTQQQPGRTATNSLEIGVIPITQMPPGEIITSSNTRLIKFQDPLMYSSARQTGFAPNSYALAYSFESAAESYSADQLTLAPVAGNRNLNAGGLSTSPKVAELAWNLTTGDDSPFDKMQTLERYLRDNFEYESQPEPAPEDTDPVEWFLFQSKRGTALHFASALALMARSVGIPARLVAGWVAGQMDGRQTIYGDMAHVWADAQFVIDGNPAWLEFDATPDGGAPGRIGGVLPPTPTPTPTPTPAPTPKVCDEADGTCEDGDGEGPCTDIMLENGLCPDLTPLPPPPPPPPPGPTVCDEADGTCEEGDGEGPCTDIMLENGLCLDPPPPPPGPTVCNEADGICEDDGEGLCTGITLENGLCLDPEGGGIISRVLGVKGPATLSDHVVFEVQGATGVGYLRTVVGESHTGSLWLPPAGEAARPVQVGEELPIPSFRASTQYHTTQIQASPVLPFGRGPLSTSLYTTRLEGPVEFQFRPYSLTLETAESFTSDYAWQALSPVLAPESLAAAVTIPLSDDLLQLPDDLPPRVVDLALQLTTGKNNDFERLEAIRLHLMQEYTYDLDNEAPPPGRDAVDFFLFDDPRGVCTAFSSAFVVLARAAGIRSGRQH